VSPPSTARTTGTASGQLSPFVGKIHSVKITPIVKPHEDPDNGTDDPHGRSKAPEDEAGNSAYERRSACIVYAPSSSPTLRNPCRSYSPTAGLSFSTLRLIAA
jgi:hypothetical protein